MRHASKYRWIATTVHYLAWLGLISSLPLDIQGQERPPHDAAEPAPGLVRQSGFECLGRMQPRRSDEIVGSQWGVSCHWIADRHALSVEQRLDQLAQTGAKWALLSPSWDFIERKKGEYDWNSPDHRLDEVVEGLAKRKILPIMQVYGGNHLYTPFSPLLAPEVKAPPQPGTEVPKLLGDPAARTAWHNFLDALARRYHRQAKVWEVWNEPNSAWFWKPGPDPAAYGRMVREVAQIVRRVAPEAIVLAGSTASVPQDFFKGLLKSDGGRSFDFASCHPYAGVPEDQDGAINSLKQLMASHGKSTALWQSECGFPSSGDTSGWGWGGPWDETKHAKWLLRRLLCDAALGMRASIYFNIHDYPSIIEGGPRNGQAGPNRKGLYRWGSWEPKPACFAFANLSNLIDDRLQAKPMPATVELLAAGSFDKASSQSVRTYALADKTTGAPVVAYWLSVPMQTVAVPGKIKLCLAGGRLHDMVLVDLLDARVYAIPPSQVAVTTDADATMFTELPLSDSPLVLCGRSLVGRLVQP